RGKPTNHVVFGEAFALLAGDALITFAFETMAEPKLSDRQNLLAMQALSYYAGPCGMYGGQQIDLENEGKETDLETLEVLHAKKTGALIKCACALGCIAAGCFSDSERYKDAIKYAEAIGLAFQITDDILDVVGDEAKLGKKCGSDEKENKTTYATLLGIEKATALASELCEKAKAIIGKYPGSEFLCALAEYIATRDN
ncbi:MAG: polyprenyl synthetase family protein, partial [Clostridia bacterium]|nr:polyprenyl synthetase family protein [Clostridia bacterium]